MHISKCGYLNLHHTHIGALFAALVERVLFIQYPIKPTSYYVSIQFPKVSKHALPPHPKSPKVCRTSPHYQPANAYNWQK
jgi:hypothetical protein